MKENMSLEPILSLQTQQDVDKCVDCPLCMEALDFDDIGFFPCSCGYQVCRFCWNRLKNDDNGLCPACRQAYPDSPIQFSQISIEAVEELKKRKKKQKEKLKFKDAAKSQNLSSVRVVQKNLLFVIGLPQRLSQDDLRKEFSKYGKIVKMVINASSAYVTYARPEDAVAAIKSLNEANQSSDKKNQRNSGNNQTQTLRASLGTTKYCTHWLRSQNCPKQPDCMYLHDIADPEASFTKEEMQIGKHTEYEKRLIQHYLDMLSKEKDQKNNRKNTNNSQTIDDKNIENKTILIQNRVDSQTNNQKQFQSNQTSNAFGGDETSNDSVGNGEIVETTGQSASPVIPFRWGTPINSRLSSNCSSNSESNSLSSTPNQTSVALASQHQNITQAQHQTQPMSATVDKNFGIKNGDMINNIDDNAIDSQMLSNGLANSILDGDDSSGEDIAVDDEPEDDGLDFDPISISSRGLQDLLRDSTQTECLMNTVFNSNSNPDYMFSNNGTILQNLQNQRQNQNYLQNLAQNQIQNNQIQSYLSKQQLLSNGYTNHSQQQQQQQQQLLQRSMPSGMGPQVSPPGAPQQWQTQQQQNCLRQLLPNVNITFQHQSLQSTAGSKPMSSSLVGNGFLNGLTSNPNSQTSQPVIANTHIRQQTIGHQMGPQMGGQSVIGQAMSTGLQHLWPQREQQKREHMFRMEQQLQRQPQQQQQQQQYHNQRLYMSGQHMSHPQMPTVGVANRPPPPGF